MLITGFLYALTLCSVILLYVVRCTTKALNHDAGVLCNITQQRAGRDLLVESSLHGLKAVVQMLTSASDIKRTGAAAAIKNVVRFSPASSSLRATGCYLYSSAYPNSGALYILLSI